MEQVLRQIASAIENGSIITTWIGYVKLLAVLAAPAVIAWIATIVTILFTERTRARVSKDVWYSQECWKEKHRLYMEQLEAIDQVFQAASSIESDSRTLPRFPPNMWSTIEDGLAAFPDHREAIESQQTAMGNLILLSKGGELFLSKDANEATDALRGTYTRITTVHNLSYSSRESLLANAAGTAKVNLLSAAKLDLRI